VSILGAAQYVFVSAAGIWYTGDTGATWAQVAAQSLQSSYAGGTHIAPDGTPLSSPTAWRQMPDSICGPPLGSFDNEACRGSNEMAYDSVHHVVYSANWHAGLWRLVTR
jgi:hypothetical protein